MYVLEVYVDDFMSLVVPTSYEQLQHVATAVMRGIHDVWRKGREGTALQNVCTALSSMGLTRPCG